MNIQYKYVVTVIYIRNKNPNGKFQCSEVMKESKSPITSWTIEVVKYPSRQTFLIKMDEVVIWSFFIVMFT